MPQPNNHWLLRQGHYWRADFENRGDVVSTGPANEESEVPFETRTVEMDLNVLWLANLGLSPQYLRLPDLRELAHGHIMARDQSGYRTRLQALYSEAFFALAMALMGAALSLLYFAYRTQWQALVGVLLAGYVAHFASKAFYLMGEFGYINAIVAAWISPLLLALATGWVLHIIQKQRGLMLRETPCFADEVATSEPGVRG
jgi:lipopolysaccharide export LptBFGC system permease protein LptF